MIPRLTSSSVVPENVRAYLQALKKNCDFHGEIDEALSSRLLVATDNSVYQVLPQAVVFPRSQEDIAAVFKLAAQEAYRDIAFSPRGGGTGTNGQSLSAGILIDCSRHMNHILEVNPEEGWAIVEPGVVLDQLNDHVRKHGLFFAPTLSPSSRATLGGMVNTDASGKGSRLYGKTSQHVLEITAVFPDGEVHTGHEIDAGSLDAMKKLSGSVGRFYTQLEKTAREHKQTIDQLPKLHRFLTGYNLQHLFSEDGKRFNANYAITGSEGTLAYVAKIKVRLTPIPQHKCLFAVLYPAFSEALDHAKRLVEFDPEAIESMDGTILGLAKTDIIYRAVEEFLTPGDGKDMKVEAINLIEFVAHDEQELTRKEQEFKDALKDFEYHFVSDDDDIAMLWELRKRSVGLLGKVPGKRKPVSGVEDTVVPPEHLAEYVKEFRAVLDAHGLEYGMFGHIDVGCLHVRPAFDLMEEGDLQKYYDIIERVVQLTHKYGGVLWGEHGKGFRSEFVPTFFGDELYGEMRKIKSTCDPHNQLNPGKIAIPVDSDDKLVNIRSEHTRASRNNQISAELKLDYELPLTCNGNGACFDYNQRDVMCPSYKITRDRRHSPKGRASLVREWARQVSLAGSGNESSNPLSRMMNAVKKRRGQYDFSHEVYAAMEGCLGCQGCKSQCPVNINVPSFRAQFMEAYHSRYARSLKQILVAYSERMGYYQSRFPGFNNFFLSNALVKWALAKFVGFVDPPLFSSPNLKTLLKRHRIPWLDLNNLPDADKSVVLVQDWVTSLYEAGLVLKVCQLIQKLGYQVYVMPWLDNGKTFHVEGMLNTFEKVVRKNASVLQKVADHGLPMVGLDPTMVLTFRYEYLDFADGDYNYDVMLLQEWLSKVVPDKAPPVNSQAGDNPFFLLSHCTEEANCDQAQAQWQHVFESFGFKLTPKQAGCCGMAGAYGHEAMHQDHSRGLFEMSWKEHFKEDATAARNLVDGFSCRAQVGRYANRSARHPVEVLLEAMG